MATDLVWGAPRNLRGSRLAGGEREVAAQAMVSVSPVLGRGGGCPSRLVWQEPRPGF